MSLHASSGAAASGVGASEGRGCAGAAQGRHTEASRSSHALYYARLTCASVSQNGAPTRSVRSVQRGGGAKAHASDGAVWPRQRCGLPRRERRRDVRVEWASCVCELAFQTLTVERRVVYTRQNSVREDCSAIFKENYYRRPLIGQSQLYNMVRKSRLLLFDFCSFIAAFVVLPTLAPFLSALVELYWSVGYSALAYLIHFLPNVPYRAIALVCLTPTWRSSALPVVFGAGQCDARCAVAITRTEYLFAVHTLVAGSIPEHRLRCERRGIPHVGKHGKKRRGK